MAAIDLDTEDKLEYKFFPISNGAVHFKVRAPNDAHISLTSAEIEANPMYEVFIGGWKNTKSVIRKNQTKPDVAEMDTPDILNDGEFRGFWIRWSDNTITVGREGEVAAFLTYEDTDTIPINFIGVCTGWGASGSWIIEDQIQIETKDKLTYNFYPVNWGALSVYFKGPSNCHIALCPVNREEKPITEMILGGWENTKSVIRLNLDKNNEPSKNEKKNVVTKSRFTKFLITWRHGRLTVKDGNDNLLEAVDAVQFPVRFIGVRTAWGATGQWRIHIGGFEKVASRAAGESAQSAPMLATAPSGAGGPGVWTPCVGTNIPPNAVQGGMDGEALFIGRASHEGAVIPGKVVPSHGVCYIAWGGAENPKEEFEVLCDASGHWVPVSGTNVPGQAFVGGQSEDGEPLFVGRVNHEGTVTLGKVQQSHGVCYIPYGGAEVAFQDYEVFVVQ